MPAIAMPEFYTINELAERIQHHPRTILMWIRAGKIPATRIGRKYLIPAAAVDAILGL